ncbi:aspartyl aminopeptidase [Viridothelium virens]|uniref:Aspartyl aminopeptidase n=1 Tax=Viridothelium virens TaxID=1048519 RepID=A0A6A6GUC6_VIRVR|nr:aspartyl aminopeptidase [Viridothelium virens]
MTRKSNHIPVFSSLNPGDTFQTPPSQHTASIDMTRTTPLNVEMGSSSRPSARKDTSIPHRATPDNASSYAIPFMNFLTDNPTVFHAVSSLASDLESAGFEKIDERDEWNLKPGGKYFVERNGSSMIAFTVGEEWEPGMGACVLAGHVDALSVKLKPIPKLQTKAGYVQLGVAPYAGGLNSTWWDRDLGVGGRVLVRNSSGKISTRLVKLDYPIARVPTLAPHFGAAAQGPFNPETQMVPIIGLDDSGSKYDNGSGAGNVLVLGGEGTFAATQPERLVKAIASELGISDYSSIINWELELFDTQPAQLGGLDKEFIFAGRIDDKLCSWAALQGLISSSSSAPSFSSTQSHTPSSTKTLKVVGLFDNEEIGSLLRQGARSNFLPETISRITESLSHSSSSSCSSASLAARTVANSFLISSDVIHAVNPNFLSAYLPNHAPRLNTGVAISADPNGHMTTDAVSTAILTQIAEKCGSVLQVFQIRNDSRSGGTVGPMLSSATGMRAIDAGLPQLSMHSIRATIGNLDPGLGVRLFQGALDWFEEVDQKFRET